jgi:uncharacterized protein YkwD
MKLARYIGMLFVMYGIMYIAIANGFGTTIAQSTEMAQVSGVSTINQNIQFHELVDSINAERIKNGSGKLAVDNELSNISQFRAQDMAINDYYSHIQPNGTDYYSLFSQRKVFSCENLNLTQYDNNSQIVADWMASDKGHRECLLDGRANSIGVAVHSFEVNGIKQYISVMIISS